MDKHSKKNHDKHGHDKKEHEHHEHCEGHSKEKNMDFQEGFEADSCSNNSSENGCDESEKVENSAKTLEEDMLNLKKKTDEYQSMLMRVAADFENYKKRMTKEKETTYTDALGEAVTAFLPILDNLERAIKASETYSNEDPLKTGLELLYKQFKDCFQKLGVIEIKSIGNKFDPEYHNAVMHIDNEDYGENIIIEEFQKGFILGEKVIRHSMVKVAN